jgi:hypothetical protein
MTSLTLFTGGTLHAAAPTPGAADDRIREGILVPWDEPGRTNLGTGFPVRRSFAQGLKAGAKVVGVYGHNRPGVDPPAVSRLLEFEDRPEGLWGRVKIARTPLGDQLLAEIDDGARDGLSIESTDLVLDEAGGIVSGSLDFFAHVPVGAYDSARASALVAELTGARSVTSPTPDAPAAPVLTAAPPMDAAEFQRMLVAALGNLQASGVGPSAPAAEPSAAALLGTAGVPAGPALTGGPDPVAHAANLQAALAHDPGNAQLLAALQDITHSGLPMFQRPAGTIGQKLWEGGSYQRRFTELMDNSTKLTSMKFTSWQWTRGPEVAAWAGDKTEVPTNPVSLEEVPGTARRCAGGWDIDRAYRDFGTTEFWDEFYREQTESYRELSDKWAAEALVSYARDISVDGNVPASYVPLDRTIDAGPTQVLKAAALGTAILEDTPRVRQGPDWIMMNTQDWLTMTDLTALDLPAFLALLKVDPANFMRTSECPAGEVILGVKRASKFRELGNGAPIRVEALDVARGGIDSAVYGYVGYSQERVGGIISVPLAPAA